MGFAAYLVPTFMLGYFWHLVAFAPIYRDLAIYREDVIVPLGLASMLVQAVAVSWLYPRVVSERRRGVLRKGLIYGLCLAAVAWSFTTLAVAAKNAMTSVPTYLFIESAFTLLQFVIVGPLIALARRS
ncbi:MAG: hypothetical protein ACOY4R_23385 [Pseudomonadota bacterium]